jgi:hypothetical protein
VKFGYWLLAISYWQIFLSGFAPAAGMGVRVKICYWLLAIGKYFYPICAATRPKILRSKYAWPE